MATEAYPATTSGRASGASPWREDLRLFLIVATMLLGMVGLGLFMDSRIAGLERQFDARFSSLEKRMSGIETRMSGLERRNDGIEAALRQLNSRVGRIEGRLGLPAAE